MLDSFGRSPETFIARHATTTDIVLFGLVVAFGPGLVAALAGVLAGLPGPTARRRAHFALFTLLGGLAAWRIGRDVTGWPAGADILIAIGCLAAAALGYVRWRLPSTATFLRYAGAASAIFLLLFLVASPTTDVAFGAPSGGDPDVDTQVAAALGDAPPPVVLVVLDALPTGLLLDGTGQVDAELYPHLGELAATSTWYRNNTSVAAFTGEAVPALLTGRYPAPGGPADDLEEENLFTLLGGSYDLHVEEQVTRLCPPTLCPRGSSDGLGTLLGDATTWWRGDGDEAGQDDFDLPAVLHDGRFDAADEWISQLDVDAGDRPDLTFLHVVLPHGPTQFTPDGSLYQVDGNLPPGAGAGVWTGTGHDVGRQRHVLQAQAADLLIGRLFDRLRASGTFDDSLVIVTADHGEAFVPGASSRHLSEANVADIVWTPLFVKAPGQAEGVVDDRNVEAVDVVPTIADELGVDIPWDVDGVPVRADPSERDDPGRKLFADSEFHSIHPEGDDDYIEIDADGYLDQVLAADPVAATGEGAVWKRTIHGDLVGRPVDDLDLADGDDGGDAGSDAGSDAGGERLTVVDRELLDDVDLDGAPLPLLVTGHVALPEGTTVAYALNGTVAMVTTVEPWPLAEGPVTLGILRPDLLRDGANELTAYVVEGAPGAETLRPLPIAD